MTVNRNPNDRDCEAAKTPADQPPGAPGDAETCDIDQLPGTLHLTEHKPESCTNPDPGCKCPSSPGSSTNCLQTLIDKQSSEILAATKVEASSKDLTDLLNAANAAIDPNSKTAYTREKYDTLVAEWLKQDAAIVGLIRQLVCAVPCWTCILDCYICPLLDDYRNAEKWLFNDEKLYTDVYDVYDLYDLQFRRQRDKATKQHRFDRIKAVLNVWLNPYDKIKKALDDNRALIDSTCKVIGCDQPGPGKAIYDVFLRIVPMHLAIAIPAGRDAAGRDTTTKIEKQYTQFCEFDKGTPVVCCGLDVGELSMRQRLIGGPLPYLLPPAEIPKLLCCLIEKVYVPAREALTQAEVALASVEKQIGEAEAKFGKQITGSDAQPARPPAGNNVQAKQPGWITSFENTAKAAIPSAIKCCDYEENEETKQEKSSRAC